jgi:flagellar biogenesis protein FliO
MRSKSDLIICFELAVVNQFSLANCVAKVLSQIISVLLLIVYLVYLLVPKCQNISKDNLK